MSADALTASTDENARCCGAPAVLVAGSGRSGSQRRGRGVGVEQEHQLGQCQGLKPMFLTVFTAFVPRNPPQLLANLAY